MIGLRFRVTGRVQGVGYRAWTCRTATQLGLVGWVRNLEDGSVEGLCCGPQTAVDALVGSLRKGPTHAQVAQLRTAPAPAEAFASFVTLPTATAASAGV